jgi:hypothetical protein
LQVVGVPGEMFAIFYLEQKLALVEGVQSLRIKAMPAVVQEEPGAPTGQGCCQTS